MGMVFYLGTHQPQWLRTLDIPLFVSHRRLRGLRRLPRARGRWALDSGGFSELSMFGRWMTPAIVYVFHVLRYTLEIGGLDWAAIQDWMCEPTMLAKTGLTVREHQRRTIASYIELQAIAPSVRWVPVVQGWHLHEYLEHVAMYADAGIDLVALDRVGVGSICRRQHTDEAATIIRSIAALGISVHAFGLKIRGAALVADVVASSDSMAWSFSARREPPLAGCVGHKNCANCVRYALAWRGRVLETVAKGSCRAAMA